MSGGRAVRVAPRVGAVDVLGVTSGRFHDMDALRGSMLLLGVVAHATLSFIPGYGLVGWPLVDSSPSEPLALANFVIRLFRMTVFFLLAGFFGRMQYQRMTARKFLKTRSKRILLPLLCGIVVVIPLNVLILVTMAEIDGSTTSLEPDRSIAPFPLAHLWFLWVLFWFYLIAIVGHKVLGALRMRQGLRSVAAGSWAARAMGRVCVRGAEPVLLAFPVVVSLSFFDQWQPWDGLPSPNADLVPQLPTLAGYGVAFAFGWFVHAHPDLLRIWRRRWAVYLAAAVAMTAVIAAFGGFEPQSSVIRVDGELQLEPLAGIAQPAYALGHGLAIWLWTLGLVGMALSVFSGFSPWRRYLADSSYWVYIVHVPLIMALQAVVAQWPVHWILKYLLILVVATPLLLLSYHYLVRSTWIGVMLNGRRYPRALPTDPATRTVKTVPG